MGEVKQAKSSSGRDLSKADILAILEAENPRARRDQLVVYVDAFLEYRAAQANIDANGTIVFHPRTGSPIDNPYLKVRNQAAAAMARVRLKNTDPIWR